MSALRRRVCVAVAVITGAALATAVPAAADGVPPVPVTAGSMATPQVDGIVFSVAIVGDTVYAGGRFTKARPAGVAPGGDGEVDRHNLLAFDLHTGELLPWAPDVSGTSYTSAKDPGPFCKTVDTGTYVCDSVFRIKKSPDGTKIYVGGDFDKIDGQWRSRIAAFTTDDGALDSGFKPTMAGRVRGLAVTDDTVYAGGGFTNVDGVPRTRLAAFDTSGGLRDWAPPADGEVFALAASAPLGRVVVGGNFNNINGNAHRSWGSVDATTGEDASWNAQVSAGTEVVTDIVIDDNGTAYAGAYDFGGNDVRFEGRAAVDVASGDPRWFDGCYGDTQAVTVNGGVLYSGSHSHDCTAINAMPPTNPVSYYRLLAETTAATGQATQPSNNVRAGDPIPELLPWFPGTNGGPADSFWKNGPWALDSNDQYVIAGGEFTTVNGQPQQGLARFAARGVADAVNKGPQRPFRAPVFGNDGNGNPVLTWTGTWDAQNSDITYQLFRVGTPDPIYQETQPSRPWSVPDMSYVDQDASGGTYYVRAVDADGVAIGSPQVTG